MYTKKISAEEFPERYQEFLEYYNQLLKDSRHTINFHNSDFDAFWYFGKDKFSWPFHWWSIEVIENGMLNISLIYLILDEENVVDGRIVGTFESSAKFIRLPKDQYRKLSRAHRRLLSQINKLERDEQIDFCELDSYDSLQNETRMLYY